MTARKSEQTVNTGEYRVSCSDGSERVCELYAMFSADDLIATFNDITERKQAEVELSKHREHLEELVASRTTELKRANRLTFAINEVVRNALEGATEEELSRTCLAAAEDLSDSPFGFLSQIDVSGSLDTDAFSVLAEADFAAGDSPDAVSDVEMRQLCGGVIAEGEFKLINAPCLPGQQGTREGHSSLSSFLGVPLKLGRQTLGVIALANKEDGYSLRDQELVEPLAATFVGAVMRVRAEVAERSLRAEQQIIRRLRSQLEEAGIVPVADES